MLSPVFLILYELSMQSMIELSRTQDEEVGDGTTSVIVLGMPFLVPYAYFKRLVG